MGLFDRFKREQAALPLAEIFHDIANFLLPRKAFDDLDWVIRTCFGPDGDSVGILFITACKARGIKKIDYTVAGHIRWHTRKLSSDVDCYVAEFPDPGPVDPGTATGIDEDSLSLAPHFAGILHDRSEGEMKYYVLGQAAIGGGTTLRRITPDGQSCDLGGGPGHELDAFIHAIKCERRRVKASAQVW